MYFPASLKVSDPATLSSFGRPRLINFLSIFPPIMYPFACTFWPSVKLTRPVQTLLIEFVLDSSGCLISVPGEFSGEFGSSASAGSSRSTKSISLNGGVVDISSAGSSISSGLKTYSGVFASGKSSSPFSVSHSIGGS